FQLSARISSLIWNSINRHETPQLLNLAKSNLSAYALLIILSTNIHFKLDHSEQDEWTINGGNIPLRSLVNDKRDLKLFKNLPPCIDTHFPIFFLDQLVLPNGSQMSWSTIATLRRCLRSGPPALWFKWISHKLEAILDHPTTIHQTSPNTLWSKLDQFASIKGSSAPWVLYRSNNDVLHIGRVRLYSATQSSERNSIDIFSPIDNLHQLIRNGKLYVTDLKHSPHYTVVNVALPSIRRLPTHHDIKMDGREYINED